MSRAAAAVLAAALALGGCASVGAPSGAAAPADPWEAWNRKVFAFNESLDANVVRPVAETYRDVVPQLVRTGVGNFFGNLRDVWSAANQFLQGKAQTGIEMTWRVIFNTTLGLGGVLDPATEMRLPRRSEDFGQTLGRWGLGNGPYLVLPLLGPSSLRDTGGFVVDRSVSPTSNLSSDAERYGLATLELLQARTELLGTTGLIDQVALDKYSFVRDAYLARRLDQVWDGAPPLESFDDEPNEPAAPASAPRK
jgi:phospholipid-binding lipoprotein MlaA